MDSYPSAPAAAIGIHGEISKPRVQSDYHLLGQRRPPASWCGYIGIIDHRILERECLAHSLAHHYTDRNILTFANLRECQTSIETLGPPEAILFYAGNGNGSMKQLLSEIKTLVDALAPAPVVVLSENQELNVVLDIIDAGARGYVQTSVSVEICKMAISLAIAGGKFIPASSLTSMRDVFKTAPHRVTPTIKFTGRQSAVAQALRCGKANKDIALDLNLCESTVKVHIRNIMKKLGATNRTEVACRVADMVCQH
jgi:DNA-binding NarL/FixJ family response regulator